MYRLQVAYGWTSRLQSALRSPQRNFRTVRPPPSPVAHCPDASRCVQRSCAYKSVKYCTLVQYMLEEYFYRRPTSLLHGWPLLSAYVPSLRQFLFRVPTGGTASGTVSRNPGPSTTAPVTVTTTKSKSTTQTSRGDNSSGGAPASGRRHVGEPSSVGAKRPTAQLPHGANLPPGVHRVDDHRCVQLSCACKAVQ